MCGLHKKLKSVNLPLVLRGWFSALHTFMLAQVVYLFVFRAVPLTTSKWPQISRTQYLCSFNAFLLHDLELAMKVTMSFSSYKSGITWVSAFFLVHSFYWVILNPFLFFFLHNTILRNSSFHSLLQIQDLIALTSRQTKRCLIPYVNPKCIYNSFSFIQSSSKACSRTAPKSTLLTLSKTSLPFRFWYCSHRCYISCWADISFLTLLLIF